MKTIGLFRHAKSCGVDLDKPDFVRTLNARGIRAARRMGVWLAEEGLAFDRVLVSPAVRVAETLSGMEEGYGRPLVAERIDTLYLAPAEDILDLAARQDEGVARLLLIGHNPGIRDLTLQAEGDPALRDAIRIRFPTAAYAEMTFDVASWSEIAGAPARLVRFVRPVDLDPGLGPDADQPPSGDPVGAA